MLIDAQANRDEIRELYEKAEVKQDELEKQKLECVVVTTEKAAQKKELDHYVAIYDKL